jgi:hypothetical protein
MAEVEDQGLDLPQREWIGARRRAELQARSRQLLEDVRRRTGVSDENRVKPGIGESTRVLLRRLPHSLILQDPEMAEVSHLLHLAEEKNVRVVHEPTLPYRAVALIQEVGAE